MVGLKISLGLSIIPLMFVAGFYAYKFINNKITSAQTFLSIVFYTLLLLATLGFLFYGGLTAIAMLYSYMT